MKSVVINGVEVAVDARYVVRANGKPLAEFVTSPMELEYLAVGFLYSEGYIADIEDIKEIKVGDSAIDVSINPSRELGVFRIVQDCGVAEALKIQKPKSPPSFEYLVKLASEFSKMTIAYIKPGLAMHTSALYIDGNWIVVHDTSRHSGVVKLVGKYLVTQMRGGPKYAFTTGRASSDMVARLASIGVDAIVTLRGPLYSGVEAACKLDIPLLSNVRGRGFTVLCGNLSRASN